MSVRERTFCVALSIPDNEAFTALATLQRLGIGAAAIRRSDIWTFEADDAAGAALPDVLSTLETVFNPNKHVLTERPGSRPLAGEVWIAPQDEVAAPSIGGRIVPGVLSVQRRVGWQLLDAAGDIVEPQLLERAVEIFLCNPAFEKAIR